MVENKTKNLFSKKLLHSTLCNFSTHAIFPSFVLKLKVDSKLLQYAYLWALQFLNGKSSFSKCYKIALDIMHQQNFRLCRTNVHIPILVIHSTIPLANVLKVYGNEIYKHLRDKRHAGVDEKGKKQNG